MKSINRASLAEIVYTKLKKYIITGKFKLGQQIVDSDIAEMLNVSKTPVREALLQLKVDGLIVIKPRSGTFVFLFTLEDIRALTSARFFLEDGALKTAYEREPVRLIKHLSQNIAKSYELLEKDNLSGYLDLDQEFHSIFFAIAGNPYLETAYQTLFSKISALRHRLVFTREFVTTSINSHSLIVNYIIEEDIEMARKRLSEHINKTFNDESLQYLVEGPK